MKNLSPKEWQEQIRLVNAEASFAIEAARNPESAKNTEEHRKQFYLFEKHRSQLRKKYKGQWVAYINGRIFHSKTHDGLIKKLQKEIPGCPAYLEQVW